MENEMKTLGDTGLMPEKKYCSLHKNNEMWYTAIASQSCEYCYACNRSNRAITEISAIPLLTVVRKAVELGLRVNKCVPCDGNGWTTEHDTGAYSHDEDGSCNGSCPVQAPCPDCNGTGFTVTELQSELEKEGS